jgi:predicted dehydrogenase
MGSIRVGVVGIGFGQQVHVPAVRAYDGAVVQAICARRPERAAQVASRLGIPRAHEHWRDLVEAEDIDAVTIATPPAEQLDIASHALRCGKPVFCEKPMALSVDSASRLAELAEKAAVAHMIDFEFLELPAWRQARSLIHEGVLGRLCHVNIRWHVETYANRMGLVSWKTTAAEGGGALNNFVAHVFYYVEHLVGRVESLAAQLLRRPGDPRAGETLVNLTLKSESGSIITATVDTHAPLGSGHRLEFYGESGTMVLENTSADHARGFRLLKGAAGEAELREVYVDPPGAGDGRVAAVAPLLSRFFQWMERQEPARPDFRDGLRVQQLLDAARRSHETTHWLAV